MNIQWVRCCQDTCEGNYIQINWDTYEFNMVGCDKNITYCPWCRVLLDTNLPTQSEG
jgi:hypothetical protein